jgi:acyl-CoA synthetase (AMP-forming)/AMP-acid ligase II
MLLVDYIDRGARIAPNSPAMMTPDGTVVMSHRDFQATTHRIARALLDNGMHPGDRVGVFSPNDVMAFACVVGIMRAGGVWVTINAANATTELADLLELTGCSRLFYHSTMTERASELIDRVPNMAAVVIGDGGRPGDESLSQWMASPGAWVDSVHGRDDEPCVMLATGGTTGKSKAVPVTNRQITYMCLGFNAHLPEATPPRYVCATPMTHAAGGVAFPVLAEGGAVIIHPGFNPGEVLASIEHNKASRIFLPPTALYALLAHPDSRTRDMSSLRSFVLAASPVSPDRLAEAVQVFGPVMAEVFGQSESPFICTVLSREDIAAAAADPALSRRLLSCGKPSLVADVAIMGDDGELLPDDQEGELVVRGGLVYGGYWNNEAASAENVRPGGWHGTGDIGVRDRDGYLYVIDRKKDMIITGGFNVFPSQVENVIHTIDGVLDCAVIGLPDEKWGEAVVAVVEAKPGATIDEAEVIAHCKAELGSVKAPKRVILRTLPRSAVGKVLKRTLRDEYWSAGSRRV